jgi:hypothetical protein
MRAAQHKLRKFARLKSFKLIETFAGSLIDRPTLAPDDQCAIVRESQVRRPSREITTCRIAALTGAGVRQASKKVARGGLAQEESVPRPLLAVEGALIQHDAPFPSLFLPDQDASIVIRE